MRETDLTIQDIGPLRRMMIFEGVGAGMTAGAAVGYGLISAIFWTHGDACSGSVLAVICGGIWMVHRSVLGEYRRTRDACQRSPAFPAARLLKKPRQ